MEGDLASVTGDAAYDTIAFYDATGARGANVVVPPTRTGFTVVGLSKTTQLLTNSGDSAVAVLAGLGKGRWYYDSKSEISFVRLHEKSNYVFRMDVFDFRKIKEIAGMLARYATDPVFLGYPYGLVEADRFARVSNEEKEYLKTLFLAEAGDLGRYLRSQDAHSVLDSIG